MKGTLIMGKLSKFEVLVNLGFEHNPFRSASLKTGDCVRIRKILNMAIKDRAMVVIEGDRGCGKSMAVSAALKSLKVLPVIVRSTDKDRLLITDIEQALILDLSHEKPRRGREIRARQLRRVLGEASRKQKVVVVIEEGHRLHGMTLRALKSLRELDWMGETELFTLVLLGQSDPMNRAGLSEVRLRSDTVSMHGLTASEIASYIKITVGRVFSKEAAMAVANVPANGNFLNLQNSLVTLMGRVLGSGRKKVQTEDVIDLYGGGQAPNKITSPEQGDNNKGTTLKSILKPGDSKRARAVG